MSKFLEDLKKFLDTQPFGFTSISEVYDNGEPETITDIPANPCQNVYSVAKFFTMTAIGILYDRGIVKPEDKLLDIIGKEIDYDIPDKRWYDVTVDMLLTHREGLPVGFLDIDCNPYNSFGNDFLKFTLQTELVFNPGEDCKYSDGAFYLLSRIVSALTGQKLDYFLRKEYFEAIGISEAAFSCCPDGYPMGATGLYIASEDVAKAGVPYLNGGLYKGKRLLSEEWVKMAVEREYTLEWDESKTILYKGGMCGQKVILCPGKNRCVSMESYGGNTAVVVDWIAKYNG